MFFHISIEKDNLKKILPRFWWLDFPHLPIPLSPCREVNEMRCRKAAPARFWFGFGLVFAKRIKISLTCDFSQINFWKHIWLQTCSLPLLLFNEWHRPYMSHPCCKKLLTKLDEERNNSNLEDVRLIHTLKEGLQCTPRLTRLSQVHGWVILTLTKNYQIFKFISQGRRSHRFQCGWFKTPPHSRFILATYLT